MTYLIFDKIPIAFDSLVQINYTRTVVLYYSTLQIRVVRYVRTYVDVCTNVC